MWTSAGQITSRFNQNQAKNARINQQSLVNQLYISSQSIRLPTLYVRIGVASPVVHHVSMDLKSNSAIVSTNGRIDLPVIDTRRCAETRRRDGEQLNRHLHAIQLN